MGRLGDLVRPLLHVSTARELVKYAPVDLEKRTIDRTSAFFVTGEKLYKTLTELILDVELKRGDSPTVFSHAVSRITRIEGIPRLMELLRALGSDALDRSAYYAYSYSSLPAPEPGDGGRVSQGPRPAEEHPDHLLRSRPFLLPPRGM